MESNEINFDNLNMTIIGLGYNSLRHEVKFFKKIDIDVYNTNANCIQELRSGYCSTDDSQSTFLYQNVCCINTKDRKLADYNSDIYDQIVNSDLVKRDHRIPD